MKRIHMHWTAGGHKASQTDRKHYHFIVEGDGTVIEGDKKPEANLNTSDGDYVAHTRGANTGAIGVSVAAMLGAKERPFNPGAQPITEKQLAAFVQLVADLCETYNIPVKRETVLTHAEIEPTLGVKQRGKWDIMWIPGMDKPSNPIKVGDELRGRIKAVLAGFPPVRPDVVPSPAPQAKGGLAALFAALAALFKGSRT